MVVGTLVLTAIGGGAIYLVTRWAPPDNANGTIPGDDPLQDRQKAARRFAAFTQRAEPLVALVACLGALLATGAVVASAARWQPWQGSGFWASLGTVLASMSSTAVALVGLAAVLALVGGKATGGKRPFGLLWDLICVVPRAAHPLGPPCYAERAVPELSRRCQAWLAPADPTEAVQRRLILSAHSLGSVLAVAVVLGLPEEMRPRVGLLTYGSQLRSYFGRIFPELLGTKVLGNTACKGPSVWNGDPWVHQQPPAQEEPPPPPPTLASILGVNAPGAGPRWRSLWRRTDYIGFAVYSYLPNDVDTPAQEYDDGNYQLSVVSHSDYPRAAQYQDAVEALRVALV